MQLPFPAAEQTSRRGNGSRHGAGCLERFAVPADSVSLRIDGGDAARGGGDDMRCQSAIGSWECPTLNLRSDAGSAPRLRLRFFRKTCPSS